jgi:hypothetical protein
MAKKIRLTVSDDKNPAVKVSPGTRLEVVSVAFIDPKLKAVRVGARLCGGSGTCLALMDIEPQPKK